MKNDKWQFVVRTSTSICHWSLVIGHLSLVIAEDSFISAYSPFLGEKMLRKILRQLERFLGLRKSTK